MPVNNGLCICLNKVEIKRFEFPPHRKVKTRTLANIDLRGFFILSLSESLSVLRLKSKTQGYIYTLRFDLKVLFVTGHSHRAVE